ncbi:pyruvate formate lyase family protein, partial [Desulfocucumis palustris]|uniref:pyruvate formate lyase family protein n=1 Tax=Desulfocucumis palustris TaxID=1898651 RepID=UPI00273A2BDD
MFEYIVENKTLYIDDNFFVGSVAQYVAGVYPYPEWNVDWMKDKEGKALSHLGEMNISDEDRKIFGEIVKYWDERCIYNQANKLFEEIYGYSSLPAQDTGLFYDGNSWPAGGGTMNYNLVLVKGVGGIIEEVKERLAALEVNSENRKKRNFYTALLITLRAVNRLAYRYVELAKKMAAEEKNYERRQELLEIADICEWVPEHPARTLKEALQSFLLIHLCLEMEVTGCGYSLGYWGQY